MGRYKVKLEQRPDGDWQATLYEDPVDAPLRMVTVSVAESRNKALFSAKQKRDNIERRAEPEWVTLDDEVPEPQSLRAV